MSRVLQECDGQDTIFLMHLFNLHTVPSPSETFKVCLIPPSQSSQLWAWETSKWAQKEAIDRDPTDGDKGSKDSELDLET